jgi:hypothetical protein
MPVSVQTPVISYTANGSATVFAYPFRILVASDLKVYKDGALQGSGFTVSGVGVEGGGSVTFTVPARPAAGVIVKLEREVPLNRVTDYVEGGALRAQVLDDDLDRVVMMVQDLDQTLTNVQATESVTYSGRKVFDTTSDTASYPFTIQHSNVFTNATPFGRGTVLIKASAQNNNQPLLITQKSADDATFGNSANLILQNLGGSTITASSAFAADLEIVANNSLYSTFNGKFELGVVSGRNTGDTRKRDGLFYIAPRRGPLHPSGENTGFEQTFIFLPLTAAGQGIFETLGNGATFTPAYDFGTFSKIEMTNAFQNSIWTNTASGVGKSARIENIGYGASYLLQRTTNDTAAIYIRSDIDTALLQLQASTVSGAGSAQIELWSGTKYWRFSHASSGNAIRLQCH